MLADPCVDPGIFARVVQARLPENSSDNGFCLLLSSTFTVLQWLFNGLFQRKKIIILQGFGGGGGPIYSRGGEGQGLGVQMLILETHRTFFSRRGCGPSIPLWIRTCDHLTTRN